jgi:hypothetical protein
MLLDLGDEFASGIGLYRNRFFHMGKAASGEADVNN